MFKTIIAPVQSWLLSHGQCVGCSMPLAKGLHEPHTGLLTKVTCKCGRIFIYHQKTKKYRRALLEEI
jgi:hypothetical protein